MSTQRDALRFLSRLIFLCGVFSFSVRASSNPAPTNQSIPWAQLGASATAHYSGDGLGVVATPRGAQLRCVLQKLEGEVTAEGLSLNSTVPGARDQLKVAAARLGRDAGQSLVLDKHGTVQVIDAQARYVRPALIEEYSVTADGIRQDFLVTQSPAGPGPLRLHLTLRGARAEVSPDGARLIFQTSGRELNYNRIRVTDATGRQLAAWMEITGESEIGNPKSKMELAVVVEDAGAVYPLRIDPTFSDANWISMGGIPGAYGSVYAAAVDDSGNLYIGGSFTLVGDQVVATNIAKWNGNSWSALGLGMGNVNNRVYALLLSGSDLYAGGDFTTAGGSAANRIAKWNGSTWSALASGMSGTVRALTISGSDLYAGGNFTTAGGISANRIAKWDGSNWSALGSGMDSSVQALAVSGTDLYAGGLFDTAGGNSANNIAKWDGNSWSSLGAEIYNFVYALAVWDGDLYVGGRFSYIAKWDGTNWSTLGSAMDPRSGTHVYALTVSGGHLYVGGLFSMAGIATNIAKWNGNTWSSVGAGMNGEVLALAVSGTDLYAGGSFTRADGRAANRIAKWNGSSWDAVGSGNASSVNAGIQAFVVSGNDLYVGGWFTTAGTNPANGVAKWNGSSWSRLGSGPFGVQALAISGSDLYAGGQFTSPANLIAKWDGSSWSALGSGLGFNGLPETSPSVNALAVSGSDLYAGGYFTRAGASPANFIAKWNGTNWSALGSGMSGAVLALAVSGNDLYAGGYFSSSNYLAKWNGSSWSTLASGVNSTVYALAVSGSDLYAGGGFTMAGGSPANRIAKWNGTSWSALGTGMSGGSSFPDVSALVVSGSDLYAGGSFTNAGGSPANYIAKWDGNSWSPLGSGMNRFGHVSALAVLGIDLYAGGGFTTAGGKASPYMAKARISGAAESITASGSSATIQFSGVVGYDYHVQRTDSLTPPMTWTTLTTSPISPAEDGSLTFTDTTAPAGTAYYRLLQN